MTHYALSANIPLFQKGSRFEAVVNHVLEIEGGYNNIKHDKGGATKYGISLRFLKAEGALDLNKDGFKDFDLDFDGDIDEVDVRGLTKLQAQNLYYRCFWLKYGCDNLPKPFDGALFDQAVNGGGVAAIKCLQLAINDTAPSLNVTVDGIFGIQTATAIDGLLTDASISLKLLVNFRLQVAKRYRAIVTANETQRKFLKGWLNRAARLGDI